MTHPDLLDPRRDPTHPSRQALEAHAFDPPELAAPVDLVQHLEGCARCREQVGTLRAEREQYLLSHPPRAFLARLDEVNKQRSRPWWKLQWVRWVLAASLAAGTSVWLFEATTVNPQEPPTIHLKGPHALSLQILVSRDQQPAVKLPDKTPLKESDLLKFVVSAPSDGFIYIANLDERGQFTRYHPPDAPRSAPIRRGPNQVLVGTTALDAAAGEERVTLLFSQRPLEDREVEEALLRAFRSAGRLHDIGEIQLPAQTIGIVHRKQGP